MATEPRRVRRRLMYVVLAAVVVVPTAVGSTARPAGAAGPSPIAVTPYSGFNSFLTRAPYVTDLTQTSADVTWATSQAAAGTLQWGPFGNCAAHLATVPSSLPTLVPASGSPASATGRQFTVNSTGEYQSTVALTGLSPSTKYCYRPLASGGTDLLGSNSSPVFTTLDPVGSAQPLSFDVVGDLGETLQSASVPFPNNLNPDQAAIDSLIGTSGARFVVTAGDVAYSGGSETDYGDLQQGGSEVSDIFGPSYWPETQGLPTFGVVGNHGQNVDSLRVWPESATAQASSGTYAFDSYPALPADGTTATTAPDDWYAFSTGNVRMYVLDASWADGNVGTSNLYQVDHDEHWTTSSPEYKWLAADLAAHPGGVKMAVFHFPVRSDNSTQSSDPNLENTSSNPNSLESLLSNNGVKVVFNGHAHTYQRIAPSGAGDVVNYVTGGGGGILEPVSGGSACSAFQSSGSIYAIGWSPTSSSGTACGAPTPASAAQVFNFLNVTVSGNTVTVSPTNAAGQVFDQQSYTYAGSSFPATIIDSPPSALTSSTSASIGFHSSPAGATFTCSLDGAAPTACTSPATYTGLAQGSHTFSVVGTNSSGTNPTPTTADWTVDTSPPSVPANLSGSAVSPHDVDLSWSASSDTTGVTGYDILRDGSVIATVSGTTLTYADITAAPSTIYQYAVDARDGAGNVSEPCTAVPVTTGAAPPGPVFVQSAGSSTTTVTLPAPSTPGDLLVLTAGLYTGATKQITAVSDGKNVWTKVGSYDVSGKNSDGEMWYAPNAASVSSVTVTTGASTVALQLMEFSGVVTSSPLDGSTGTAATGTSASSGTATPGSSDDLAVGFIAGHNNTQTISASSPGYTVPTQVAATSPNPVTVETGYQDVGTPGPQSFAGTFGTAMYWAAGIALFKPGAPSPPSNDFSIGAGPTSATVTAGSPATSTISTTVTSGVTQSVALSATGAPTGALVSFNPQTINAGQSSTMTVTTSSTTPTGTYPITVTGTGSSATHATSYSLTVNPAPVAPTITSSTGATFTVGSAGSFTVTTGGVPTPSLSESGSLPTGVGFTDNGNGTATLSGTPATGTAASYPITIGAANGVGSPASQSFTLTVDPPVANDFSIGAGPTSATVTAGSPATSTISTTVTSGATQPVALSATGAPTGALVSFNPQTINAGQSSTMTVTTSSTTPTGTSTITVTGTGSSATHATSYSLTVNPVPPNDFSIGAGPTSATVTAGSPATSTISTTVTSGVTQSVALSATGAPTGALVSFNPQTINAGQSSTMTVTTSSTTPTGTSTITVTGTGSSATHATSYSLTVNPVSTSAPALVQSASATETATATSLTGSFPSATKAGDLLVLSASEYTGATNHLTSVTDSAGNTWTRVGAYDASGHNSNGELWYSAGAAPVTTVTVHTTAAASVAFGVQEFSGVATTSPLDVSTGTANTSTAPSSGPATTSVANELVVGFIAGHSNTEAITANSLGYTDQAQQTTTGTVSSIVTGYQVVGTPGPQSFAGTFGTAMYWAAGIALFKPGAPPPPSNDFSIGAGPTSATVTAGSPATSTISTTVTSGVTQSVALSATGAPTGALVSFNPQTINAGQSSTMTVTTSSTTPTGTYPITVTGTGSSATHATSYSLTVNPAPVAPTITSSTGATFTVGSAGSFTVTTGGVPTPSLSESGSLPTGVGFTDNGNGTATLSGTPATGTAASYPITIGAANGVGSPASQSFTLTVDPPVANDFSIGAGPTSATVTAGSPATSTISTTVTSGATQPVALSATGAPTGALVSFNPQTINAGQSSTMTVTTSSTTPTGTSTITVTGTGSSATHATSYSLTVNPVPPNDFSIGAGPTSATVTAGSPATSTISTTVTSGVTQSVALSATGAPTGALVSFNPQTINAGQSSTMTVTTSSTTPTGTSTITVTGTGSSATHATSYSLTVNPVSTSAPALVQSASATETATATSLTGSFPSATKAGDLLVLSASEYTGATNHLTSVTDSAGNTWTRVGAYDASGHNSNGELWYSAGAAPVTTVTVHTTAAASVAFGVQEFSGVATTSPLDVSTGTANTSTAPSSGPATTSVANELVVGFIAGHSNTEAITANSLGYTDQAQQTTTGTVSSIVTGYQVVGTPGPQSFAGTFGTAMYWAAGIAVFKP